MIKKQGVKFIVEWVILYTVINVGSVSTLVLELEQKSLYNKPFLLLE